MPCVCLTGVDKADDDFEVNPASLRGTTVIFAFPRTGKPGEDIPKDWDMIPGKIYFALQDLLPFRVSVPNFRISAILTH